MRIRENSHRRSILNVIRGTEKPIALRHEEWDSWHSRAKKAHPVRYWIAETAYNFMVKCLNTIPSTYYNVLYYVECRFFRKTHALTSQTLKKGRWHDYDDRVLYCLFDEFCNFVEEDARLNVENLANLEYNSEELGYDPHDPNYLGLNSRLQTSKSIRELYDWWKTTRPSRVPAEEVAGWKQFVTETNEKYKCDFIITSKMSEDDQRRQQLIVNKMMEVENSYCEEDDLMLIKLIELRRVIKV